MDRLDLAKQTYNTAKIWAEDSLIIQLCEAWIGLKQGGEDDGGYQTAFYCYDEMSQLPSANNPVILNGKAVAQAALHRWPEAEAPLTEALQTVSLDICAPPLWTGMRSEQCHNYQDPNHATPLANAAAIALLSGKPAATHSQYME